MRVFDLEGVEGEGDVAVVTDDGDDLDHACLAEAGHARGVVGRGDALVLEQVGRDCVDGALLVRVRLRLGLRLRLRVTVDGALLGAGREGGCTAARDRRDVLVDEARLPRLDDVDSPLAARTVGVRGGEDRDLGLMRVQVEW